MTASRRTIWQFSATLMLVAMLSWSAGFALFAWRATRPAGPVPTADGIVVLTGGAGRIETAFSLLVHQRARLLLISGVTPRLDLPKLMHASGLALPQGGDLAPRIELGHAATSTFGNARETAIWAHAHELHSLIVVTAGYHMQRALAEIGSALPEAALLPYPVLPPAMLRPGSFSSLRLLVSEYDKWLLVAASLAGRNLGEIA